MIERDYSYDYLRAFAAIMIVLCHMSYGGFGLGGKIGNYLAGTYVDVFLLLSAYLLGINSRKKIVDEPWNFLKKRGGRLIPTYYTFLTTTFLIIVFIIGYDALSTKQILGHYLFLNWFWQSARVETPAIGHLWFMSCIMFGYISVVCWAQLARQIPKLNTNRGWIIYFVIWALLSTLLTMRIRFAVYPCTVMLGFVILFFKGKEIMDKIRLIKTSILVLLLVICNLGGVVYYLSGGYDCAFLMFWINLLNSLLWIACAPLIFKRTKISRTVLFISTISFEIYLIHHPFCMGAYSLVKYMPVWMASVCIFVISIFGGWILSILTSKLIELKHNLIYHNS